MGDRSRGRFATPADFPRHDCRPTHTFTRTTRKLGFVHRSRDSLSPRAKPSIYDSQLLHRCIRDDERRVDEAQVTAEMQLSHNLACSRIKNSPASWTSHTVAVIDQSGSMRKTDLEDGATRSDAVWLMLAIEFVARRLESGEASDTDVLSLVVMNEDSTVLLDRRPVDWLLFNDLVTHLRVAEPLFAGNYLPAFDKAEQLLRMNTHGNCSLLLLFLSDGRPSDRLPSSLYDPEMVQYGNSCMQKFGLLAERHMGRLASRFGRRLTVGAIGFGSPNEDFSVLTRMTDVAKEFGSIGFFQAPSLDIGSLGLAMSSLTLSLSASKTELTQVSGSGTVQRTVRDVHRERSSAADDLMFSDEDWYDYRVLECLRWDLKLRGWREVEEFLDFDIRDQVRGAIKKAYFGEGAERLVTKFRWIDPYSQYFVGPLMVAKEDRFIEPTDKLDEDTLNFHIAFLTTQYHAQRIAEKFNEKLETVPGVTSRTPRISFLDCFVCMVEDPQYNRNERGFLVEKMLDPTRYHKYNSNGGYVAGQAAAAVGEPSANPVEPLADEGNAALPGLQGIKGTPASAQTHGSGASAGMGTARGG